MGLAEDFRAEQETREQSRKFQLEQDFRAYLSDKAKGGSITTAPPSAPLKENAPIGAVVGGVGGALVGGAVGNAPGAIAGATIGAGAGQYVQGKIENAMGLPHAPRTSAVEEYRIGREALLSGGMEALGQAAGFLVPKVRGLAPFAPAVTPEAKAAMRFVQEHGGIEQSLLPAEMTSNRFLDILQNISEHSLLGGGAIQTFKQDRDAFNTGLAQAIVGRYGPAMDADAIGRAVVDSARYNLEASKYPAQFIYEAIESAAAPQYAKAPKTVTVTKDTEPVTKSVVKRERVKRIEGEAEDGGEPSLQGLKVKTSFQDIQVGEQLQRMKVMVTEQETQIGGARIDLRELKNELAGVSRTAEEAGGLVDTAMGNTLLSFINKKPDMVSYPVAKAMRTEIRAYRDALMNSPETKNAPGIAKANSIYDKLTQQIRKGLADDDPFLATMWDEANLIEAGANQQFNTKMIRELVKLAEIRGANAPEAIVEKVWRSGRPTQVKVVRNAVGPTTWQKMQQIEMERLMKDSFENGIPNGNRMEAAFFGKGGPGEDVLEAGFDRATVKELHAFVDTLKTQQKKSPDNTGRMWIQLAQASAVVGVIAGAYAGKDVTPEASLVVFGPAVVSNLLVRPGVIKWLTEGLTTTPGTKRWVEITTQLSKALQAGVPRDDQSRPGSDMPNRPSTQLQPMPNAQ